MPRNGERDSMLERGVEILQAFRPTGETLSLTSLTARTGLPKPTVYRLATTLTELGLLERQPAGGYALGIAMPPNWVGHTYLANDAFEQFTWQPGYVTNYENVLFDRAAGFSASYMETLLMTEDGIEALSTRPRTLTVVPG